MTQKTPIALNVVDLRLEDGKSSCESDGPCQVCNLAAEPQTIQVCTGTCESEGEYNVRGSKHTQGYRGSKMAIREPLVIEEYLETQQVHVNVNEQTLEWY